MSSTLLDERSTQHAPISNRPMHSSHSIPRPSARKRISTHLEHSLQPSSKRLKFPVANNTAVPVPEVKAKMWFEDTNKDASRMNDIQFQDNDPPFYLSRRLSSDGNSACAVPSIDSNFSRPGSPTAPTRSLLARLESSESHSEDFRSVIDDLTIQNKKLKRKLRKYERLHCSHLQEEKMFEVRIHGLAANRRRELEETLRRFASSIEDDSPETVPPLVPSPLKHSFSDLPSALNKPSSSSTLYSTSKPNDSAYASMSGQTGPSQSQSQDQKRGDIPKPDSRSNQQNVKSYLQDIPQNFLPKHSMAMSGRLKSKMVVKRLEQIFTGKGAASKRHKQSHQQQEVSESAAQLDKNSREVRGRPCIKEGVRQARILSTDAEMQVDNISEGNVTAGPSRQSNDGRESSRSTTHISRDASPEQRPTRPLDLDLYRAQVVTENLEYLRHLGIANPTGDVNVEGDGWIPLNLLTSMAQLHTLNVTPEFIRQAITDISRKFDSSTDGTKVKWRGGGEGSRMSPDSDDSEDSTRIRSAATSMSVSKRGSITDLSTGVDVPQEPNTGLPPELSHTSEVGKRRPATLGQSVPENIFSYKPLFFHGSCTESDDSAQGPTSSSNLEHATALNSGVNSGSHGLHEAEATLRRHNASKNGPIIFYHKARFCTDLSGDPSGARIDEGTYRRFTQQPIGCQAGSSIAECNIPDDESMAGSLTIDAAEFELDSVPSRSILNLDELKSCISDCAVSAFLSSPAPVDMEMSGLGGIQPEDNFVVKVQVRHDKQEPRPSDTFPPFSGPRIARRFLHRLPEGAMNAYHEREAPRSQPRLEIVSTVNTKMAPSSLPPPSFLCIPFSQCDSDDEGDTSVSINSRAIYPNQRQHQSQYDSSMAEDFGLRPAEMFVGSSSEQSNATSYASTSPGSDDSSSIDLLAHARELDPDTIAAREREFDRIAANNVVQAPSIPQAVSSAATTSGETSEFQLAARAVDSDVDSMDVDGDVGSIRRMSQ